MRSESQRNIAASAPAPRSDVRPLVGPRASPVMAMAATASPGEATEFDPYLNLVSVHKMRLAGFQQHVEETLLAARRRSEQRSPDNTYLFSWRYDAAAQRFAECTAPTPAPPQPVRPKPSRPEPVPTVARRSDSPHVARPQPKSASQPASPVPHTRPVRPRPDSPATPAHVVIVILDHIGVIRSTIHRWTEDVVNKSSVLARET